MIFFLKLCIAIYLTFSTYKFLSSALLPIQEKPECVDEWRKPGIPMADWTLSEGHHSCCQAQVTVGCQPGGGSESCSEPQQSDRVKGHWGNVLLLTFISIHHHAVSCIKKRKKKLLNFKPTHDMHCNCESVARAFWWHKWETWLVAVSHIVHLSNKEKK